MSKQRGNGRGGRGRGRQIQERESGTDWLRKRSLKELFLDAGPVEEGLVEPSSVSSTSKLRLQDLTRQK